MRRTFLTGLVLLTMNAHAIVGPNTPTKFSVSKDASEVTAYDPDGLAITQIKLFANDQVISDTSSNAWGYSLNFGLHGLDDGNYKLKLLILDNRDKIEFANYSLSIKDGASVYKLLHK
jgi:hypothetical protein